MSIYLSSCLSIYLCIYLPTYLSIYISSYLPIYLSIYLPIYLPTYLPIHKCIPIFLSTTYLPIYLAIYLAAHLANALALEDFHPPTPTLHLSLFVNIKNATPYFGKHQKCHALFRHKPFEDVMLPTCLSIYVSVYISI